jgi:hypothetical protein
MSNANSRPVTPQFSGRSIMDMPIPSNFTDGVFDTDFRRNLSSSSVDNYVTVDRLSDAENCVRDEEIYPRHSTKVAEKHCKIACNDSASFGKCSCDKCNLRDCPIDGNVMFMKGQFVMMCQMV